LRIRLFVLAVGLAASTSFAEDAPSAPAPAPKRPVVDDYFGTKLVDNYRWMETLDAETLDWIRAQGRHTRALLDSIPARADYRRELTTFTGSFGTVQSLQSAGGRTFYLYRPPGAEAFDLRVRDANGGTRKLVDIAALAAGRSGDNFAINYFSPSPDGRRVALGISKNGSEDAGLTVIDAMSGRKLAGQVTRAVFAGVSWTPDGAGLYFNRLDQPAPGVDRYLHSTANYWDLKREPASLSFAGAGAHPNIEPQAFPYVKSWDPAGQVALIIENGVQQEIEIWLAPRAGLTMLNAVWRLFATRADEITAVESVKGRIFLLSHRDAPTFQVLSVAAVRPLNEARVALPRDEHRVLESIHAASDGLYVVARDGVYSHLLRLPIEGGAAQEIALPFAGDLTEVHSSAMEPGLSMMLQSWVVPTTALRYDARSGKLTVLALDQRPHIDTAAYQVMTLAAPSHDGVKVPLTLVRRTASDEPVPLLLYAYGSYGLSTLPQFRAYQMPLMERGAATAFCHVRGGGELGEAWHAAGKGAQKANTWRDLIGCAEYLIAAGITTHTMLFLRGGSAGGGTVSRTMEDRPDLFAGVIAQVPGVNPLRMESAPGGAANVPEFGSVSDPQGFRNLFEVDAYVHVQDGTRYPPIMITTGLNDPRVLPWEPAKFAARLLDAQPDPIVLLRVDEHSGHGIGSTRSQIDELFVDIAAFMFWRSGFVGWQPTATLNP